MYGKEIYMKKRYENIYKKEIYIEKADFLSQNTSLPSTFLFKNLFLITFLSKVLISFINTASTENPSSTKNFMSLGNSSFIYSLLVNFQPILDPYF